MERYMILIRADGTGALGLVEHDIHKFPVRSSSWWAA